MSAKEQAELDKLTTAITELPLGGRASMILSEEHEQLLRKIEQELQESKTIPTKRKRSVHRI